MPKIEMKKPLMISAAAHAAIFIVSIITFVVQPHVSEPSESVAIDIISADQLARMTKGIKSGEKDKPKPLVEKVAEAKPVDDAVGKIDKREVVTSVAPQPTPPQEKPVEKKPDPPKPVVEKPKEQQKAEKKEEVKIDPIAEALKKDDAKKPAPKQETKAAPAPPVKPKERVFDANYTASLLDKRDPTRLALAGESLNSTPALGGARGTSADNSATWGAMFKSQVERCWTKPYGGETRQPNIAVVVRLGRDGTLQAPPKLESPSSEPATRAYQETALRAMLQCQPYRLPPAMYEGVHGWNYFTADFVDDTRG